MISRLDAGDIEGQFDSPALSVLLAVMLLLRARLQATSKANSIHTLPVPAVVLCCCASATAGLVLQATSKANSIHPLSVLLVVVLLLRARPQATSKANSIHTLSVLLAVVLCRATAQATSS